jgi:hypothetical protein
MSLDSVRQNLINRLDQSDRGDRGWFIITRVHVATSWIKAITEYLESRSSGSVIELNDHDYRRLATIIESNVADPGTQLRRHHLLVMDKPLRLIQRVRYPYWSRITLSERGRELAYSDDPAEVLEEALSEIRFAIEPWMPPNRVAQYNDFDVPAYEMTRLVLENCNGFIDRNEFDFFLSRMRNEDEIDWVIDSINEIRELSMEEKENLHVEVQNRIPGAKAYSNWRDISLHTFSLFALGTSMIRQGQKLLLTTNWVRDQTARSIQETDIPQLRIPEPPEHEELLTPPAAPASNDGADAESFVAKVLRSQGWEVSFYTNRRGYGFDLWARRDNYAMMVEVKSSLGRLATVNLTSTEYQAAEAYGDNYVLALVENMDSNSPNLRMVQNPVEHLIINEQESTSYTITRAEWLRASSRNI